ncbi:MAG: ABC transporter permease [Kiritimatiellia bacterium]
MNSFSQLLQITRYEWFTAIRSRRAMVILLLYMAAAICTMNFSINALQKMEQELVKLLQLPETEEVGVVSKTLWKSKPFQRIMKEVSRDNNVYDDLVGKHPVELIFAWLVFFYTPLLVVLVSANRISDDIGSGSIRYVAFRSSRFTWSFGKFLGQAGMIGAALLLSGIGAYIVALIRLHGTTFELLTNIFVWSLRAWIYSIPFLGLAMGLSHLTRSGSKATILGILSISGCFVISAGAHFTKGASGWKSIFAYLATVVPDTHRFFLWRNSAAAVATGATWMITLALCYLFLGYLAFRRRDI